MPNPDALEGRITRIARRVGERGICLEPPLTEDCIRSFEAKCGCVLPEGYRAFLRYVGNGGAGPASYGLVPLGATPDDMSPAESRTWVELQRVSRPFPFTKPWVWEDGNSSDEGTREQVEDGTLHLGTDGCGQYWLLVVCGPERGNVWMLADVGITHTMPKRDFLQWYEDWLDGVSEWWA
ncbi:MAG: SMI1/KNR4 family protein [Tepidisphaeraceae bacterium]